MNRNSGLIHIDALFSIIPVVLTVVYFLNYLSFIQGSAEHSIEQQKRFDKLVLISDYLIKDALAVKNGQYAYPNLIENTGYDYEKLKKEMELEYLHVGFEPVYDHTCIYRLIAYGEEREIRKLYICGE